MNLKEKLHIYKEDLTKYGLRYIIISRFTHGLMAFLYWKDHRNTANKSFMLDGKHYPYFVHPYNWTSRNERTVEVGYMLDVLRKHKQATILEIGNVLAHYTKITHDVIDKYEVTGKVINEDIVSFHPIKTYDLIISVSTMEHVGWDEHPRERMKIVKAFKQIQKLLKINGVFIFTCPIGYNKDIDLLLKKGTFPADECIYMKRISFSNLWRQVSYEEVKNVTYNKPYPNSNAILIAKMYKQ